ncbi:hypothetical protein PIB30_004804 [Stylosanthes scabra]|uniref:CCHC-type domain-containing protein n=1 Tax=Stylosanthes scabra TaxID=79078 RepID=A0ABU6T5S8_9FABA|nr:hypothetical protein [Stylosanthes scabra]
MDSIRATYSFCIKPVNSEQYWTPTGCLETLPLTIKRPAHRPKYKRRVDQVEKEMNPNKVRKTFEVTCNKCGEKEHYYKTCKNYPQDPNWKPMTKKERRTAKGGCASTATASSSQPSHTQARARKNKKKIPKPGVRGLGNTSSQTLGQGATPRPGAVTGLHAHEMMKLPIIRPQSPPTTAPNEDNNTNPPRGVTVETIAATSSGTAARLFRYMPTPGFKPPRPK